MEVLAPVLEAMVAQKEMESSTLIPEVVVYEEGGGSSSPALGIEATEKEVESSNLVPEVVDAEEELEPLAPASEIVTLEGVI